MRTNREKLRIFLYVLTREHLPIGVIEKILQYHVEANPDHEPRFSSPQIASLVEDWAQRLIGDEPEPASITVLRRHTITRRLRDARQQLRDHFELDPDAMFASRLITEALAQLGAPAPGDSSCDEPTAGT